MHRTSPGRRPRTSDTDAGQAESRVWHVALFAAGLVLFLLSALLSQGARAQGAPGALLQAPAAALFFKSEGTEQVFAAPVLSSDVVIEIAGDIARVAVRQHFRNPSKAWLEGVYVFPLPEESAVDRLRMRIGDRLVEGRILEREEAEAVYRRAAAEGRHASLLSSERPNVFSTAVANIGPGEEITVEIEYQDRVRFADGAYDYRFPLVVAPRYTPQADIPLVAVPPHLPAPWPTPRDIAHTVPAGTTPGRDLFGPVRHPGDGKANPVTLAVLLNAGVPLATVASPSHAVTVEREDPAHAVVTLAKGLVPADRDFVLTWRPVAGATPSVGLFAEEVNGAAHLAVSILPPDDADWPDATGPRDLVLVLDKSGSMSGPAMEQAKQAVRLAIRRLSAEDRFNLIAFDDRARALFPSARPASATAVREALGAVDRLEADGGTEMAAALDLALADGDAEGRMRQIVFVTDGAVSNERALFARIAEDLGEARLFTVGIGAAPNSFFMRRAAAAGRGTFTYVGEVGEVEEKVGALLRKLERPALTDIELQWDVPTSRTPEVHPARIPDLYQGEPIGFAARLPGRRLEDLRGSLTLSGRIGERRWEQRVDLSKVRPAPGVAAIWAKAEIDELRGPASDLANPEGIRFRVIKTALAYRLVTEFTSLVAVDETAVARPPEERLESAEIARNLPEGMDFAKVFGKDALGPRGMAPVPAEMLQDAAFRTAVGLPATATPALRMAIVGALALLAAAGLLAVAFARRRT